MARILIVDDEESIRDILSTYVEALGHEATLAASGEEAVTRFREERHDLILSDVMMEGMNGFELLEALKPSLGDRTPFVILSSHADPDAIDAALYAGVFDYLVKPFNAAAVRQVLEQALASTGHRDRPTGSSTNATGPL